MPTTDELRDLLTEPAPGDRGPDLGAIRDGARRRTRRRRVGVTAGAAVVTAVAVGAVTLPQVTNRPIVSTRLVTSPAPTTRLLVAPPPSGREIRLRLVAAVRTHLPGDGDLSVYAHADYEPDSAVPPSPAADAGTARQWDVIAYSGAGSTGSRIVLQAAWVPPGQVSDPDSAACGAAAGFAGDRGLTCTTQEVDGVRVDLLEGADDLVSPEGQQRVAVAYRQDGRSPVVVRERLSLEPGGPTTLAWSLDQLRDLVLDPRVSVPEPPA